MNTNNKKLDAKTALANIRKQAVKATNEAIQNKKVVATLRIQGGVATILIPMEHMPIEYLLDIPIKLDKIKISKKKLTAYPKETKKKKDKKNEQEAKP